MTATPKKKRQRSPNYPSLDLKQAIDKARALFDADRRHAMPSNLAHERWGYKSESSAAQQCEAALKAYGLLDAHGTGKSRKLSVSEKAERIIRDAPDRGALLKVAALGPKIHSELWEKYLHDGLPSDEIIRTYLLWERESGQFNEEAIGDVIRRFRSSIGLAKLDSSSMIEEEDEGDEEDGLDDVSGVTPDKGNGKQGDATLTRKTRSRRKEMIDGDTREEVFVVPEGGDIVLQFPTAISQESFDDFKDWVQIAIRKIGRLVQEDPPEQTGND